MIEKLLDLCYEHRVYTQYYRGRWFVALGDFFGFGTTLPELLRVGVRMWNGQDW